MVQLNSKVPKLRKTLSSSEVNKVTLESVNITLTETSTYDVVKTSLLPKDVPTTEKKYGAGQVQYTCSTNGASTILCGKRDGSDTFMVRAVGEQAVKKLGSLLQESSEKFASCKVSNSVATMGIPLTSSNSTAQLIEDAVLAQKGRLGRTRFSVLSDGTLAVGSANSTKYIQICEVKDTAKPPQKCLSVQCQVKETSAKFITSMHSRGLTVLDMHGIIMRDVFTALNDCQLKEVLMDFIAKNFSLPSKESLKQAKGKELSKIKYVRSALTSSLKYMTDPVLKDATGKLFEEFIPQMQSLLKERAKKN